MKKIALASVVIALSAGTAFAAGPSGSSEGAPHTGQYNNITCRHGTNVQGTVVYAGTNGVEICNAGRSRVPLQGRVIATNQQGGYVAADGDRDNKQNAYLQGYARFDRSGAHCGKPKKVEDSTTAKQPRTNTCP